jgi:hypothetical protein
MSDKDDGYGMDHKVRIYNQSVCPLVGIGTLSTSLSPASVPLQNRGGRAHPPARSGVGGVPIPTT